MTPWMWAPLGKITEKIAGYLLLENHRVHPAFLPQALLRASEAAGREDTNPAPAKGALSSPPPCAAETWAWLLRESNALTNRFCYVSWIEAYQVLCKSAGLKLINLAGDKLGMSELFQADVFWGCFLGPGGQLPLMFQIWSPGITEKAKHKKKMVSSLAVSAFKNWISTSSCPDATNLWDQLYHQARNFLCATAACSCLSLKFECNLQLFFFF